jgi:hypothetical protein
LPIQVNLLGITLSGQSLSQPIYLAKKSESWNKIYLELSEWLKVSDFPAYKIVFIVIYPTDATEPSYKIQLDNIQVSHL